MLGRPSPAYRVVNKTKSSLLGDRIRVADSSLTRLIGLLGKRRLEAGGGLLIVPSQGVHTMGMMFPIDVAFLDEDLKVLAVRPDMGPFRVTAISWKTHSVLELPSGTLASSQTTVEDVLALEVVESL